jgi:Zn-dependent protease with chaperone function
MEEIIMTELVKNIISALTTIKTSFEGTSSGNIHSPIHNAQLIQEAELFRTTKQVLDNWQLRSTKVTVAGKELHMLYNPYVLRTHGFIYCAVQRYTRVVIVFYDDDFSKLSENSKSVILHHEVGHIVNESEIDSAGRIELVEVGECSKVEHDADSFAASILGIDPVITALQEMIEITSKNYSINRELPIKEFNMRIRYLRKKKINAD